VRRVLERIRRLELQGRRYCFDEIIREDEYIVVAKNVEDAEEVSPRTAEGLRSFSVFLEGLPVVVSEKAAGERLEDNIVYTRYRLPVVTRSTLERLMGGGSDEPLIYISKGGVYVRIRGEELRRIREEKGLSRGELARLLGVSRRTVLYYEKGLSDASLPVAAKMEEHIGDRVFARLTLEELKKLVEAAGRRRGLAGTVRDNALRYLLSLLSSMGFEEYIFSKTPFDAGAKREPESSSRLLLGREGEGGGEIESILEVTESKAILLSPESSVKRGERVLLVPREKIAEVKKHLNSFFNEEN